MTTVPTRDDGPFDSVPDAVHYLGAVQWHDSVLYRIELNRERSADEVTVVARLLAEGEPQRSRLVRLTFLRCLSFRGDFQWGVDCMSDGEMIYGATAVADGPAVERVRAQWASVPWIDLQNLGVFELELASTGSRFEVVFQGLRVTACSALGDHTAPPPLPTR
jgi:hypothetical protein